MVIYVEQNFLTAMASSQYSHTVNFANILHQEAMFITVTTLEKIQANKFIDRIVRSGNGRIRNMAYIFIWQRCLIIDNYTSY